MNSAADSEPNKRDDERAQQLFLAALEVAPEQRLDWVQGQSKYHEAVRARVTAMLQADAAEQETWGKPDDSVSVATVHLSLPPMDSTPKTYPRIANYEVLEEVARGGMGVVYKARQHRPSRIVAIKMIRGGAFASRTEVERFITEAEAAAQLDDEAVVPVYELGVVQGEPFIAMKYIDGDNLESLLRAGKLSLSESLRILIAVCRAVAIAHRRGIVHRDLKPSNILIERSSGRPWLTDFGLAKYLDKDSRMTSAGDVLGTPGYMAPEQAWGNTDAVTAATDVYGLGAILYRLLTGSPPIQSDAANLARTIQLIRDHDVIAPRSVSRKIPRALDTVCMKCLEAEPRQRFADAGELADDLQRFLDGETVQARPLAWTHRLHRWARHRPGLAVTWCALATFYLYHLAARWFDWIHDDPAFNMAVASVSIGAATLAWIWQRLLIRRSGATWVLYAWLTSDVMLLTLMLFFGDSVKSPLVVLYHVVVAGSVLRCRTHLVGYVTLLAIGGYCFHLALTHFQLTRAKTEPPWSEVVPMLLSLVLIGIIQYFSLRRSNSSYESPQVR
ncbi:MAG: serine/threonine protein kinase [Planctomycetales bacterium]|nr:serine/threonine protein kinase [Planctomycetales bacterium]